MVVGIAKFLTSKMIVEFFWSLGFAEAFVRIFEICFVASLAIIQMFFECLSFLTPSKRIVDSFSDGKDFVESLIWKRPPKKPPDESCNLNPVRVRFD